MRQTARKLQLTAQAPSEKSADLLKAQAAHEMVFAVVGHVGSGTSKVAEFLATLLGQRGVEAKVIKASACICSWARTSSKPVPTFTKANKTLPQVRELQNLGDEMRRERKDHSAVAQWLIKAIQEERPAAEAAAPVPRAYILDSLRHPAEVQLLRRVYQSAFVLVGVVCDEGARAERLSKKYTETGRADAQVFMERDRKSKDQYGQRVEAAFHLSDYFIDNTPDQFDDKGKPNEAFVLSDALSRLVKIACHSEIVRPRAEEVAMYAAEGAKLRSACLSRQVGAALLDPAGNLLATGSNEVPAAGGGTYAEGRHQDRDDARCSVEPRRFCSNTREQTVIQREVVDALLNALREAGALGADVVVDRESLADTLGETRIGSLIEFSRAIHAEMDALLAAARQGGIPLGTRMFVTTFPCHSCARHIVCAGVDEVQYIEPYPKSRALHLHSDSITVDPKGRKPTRDGGPVLFRPFTGVAPRLYARAFLKDRDLKDEKSGSLAVSEPTWGTPWDLTRAGYLELEKVLTKHIEEGNGSTR